MKNQGEGDVKRKLYIYLSDIQYITTIHVIIMVKIQVDLSEEEDKIVEIYKLTNRLKTKQEAIRAMIRYFEVKIRPKNVNEKDYYST